MVRRRQEQTQKPIQVNKHTFFKEDSPQDNISKSIPTRSSTASTKSVPNQRKSPNPVKAPPVQYQQNKRKHIANKDSDEEAAPPKRSRTSDGAASFWFPLLYNNSLWRFVQIKGSYPIRRFVPTQVVKNRPLYHLMRDISEILYRNIEDYQKNELCEIQKRHPSLDKEGTMALLRIMCKKTMKYESEGLTVVFEVEPLIVAAREAFSMDRVEVPFDDLSVFLQQLRLICQVRKIAFSEEDLIQIRNWLSRFFNYVQTGFIQTILNIDKTKNVEGLRKVSLAEPNAYKCRSDINILTDYSFLSNVRTSIMLRSSETSLWVLILFESKRNLLDHVVPYALANCLPVNVREFLTDWMVKVQRRMRKRLTNGDLKRVADFYMPGKEKWLAFNSPLLEELLKNIFGNVLNCLENFKVFNEDWLNELLGNFRERKQYQLSEKLLESSQSQHLRSLFPNTESSEHLLRHLTANLFHFFIRFGCHTLRFVFKVHLPNKQLQYNGKLELEEVPNFKEIDRVEEELERSRKSPPIGIPQVQVMKPRRTLLPTPVIVQPTVPQMIFQPPLQNLPPMNIPPPNYPVYQPPVQEFKYIPINPSPLIRQVPPVNPIRAPKIEPVEPNLSVEVTEEELKRARNLRTPSEVSGGHLNQEDEDEDVPKKWKDTYRLLLEWQQDLRDELKNVKERYEKIERL